MSEELFVCGAINSPADARDYVAHVDNTDFPEEFELKMPEVKYQGSVGSCVAHAISSAIEYFAEKELKQPVKISTGWIYGNRRDMSYKGQGMVVREALLSVLHEGAVRYELLPENTEVPYAIERVNVVHDHLVNDAAHFKLKEIAKITDNNTVKQYLINGAPVIVSMSWYNDMKVVNGIMNTTQDDSNKKGSHCMVIYGWDKNGWKIQNSWGTLWGDNGRFVYPYEYTVKEFWGITDDKTDVGVAIVKPNVPAWLVIVTKIYHTLYSWFYNIKIKLTKTKGD